MFSVFLLLFSSLVHPRTPTQSPCPCPFPSHSKTPIHQQQSTETKRNRAANSLHLQSGATHQSTPSQQRSCSPPQKSTTSATTATCTTGCSAVRATHRAGSSPWIRCLGRGRLMMRRGRGESGVVVSVSRMRGG